MHVGLVSPVWPYGALSNGIVTYVHWLREGLRALGHQVSIFTYQNDAAAAEPDVHLIRPSATGRATHVVRRAIGRPISPFRSAGDDLRSVVAAVHRRRPLTVVETEESFGVAASLIAAARIPVVVKLHGPAFLSTADEGVDEARAALEGEMLRSARFLTAPSATTLADTVRRYALTPSIAEQIANPLPPPPAEWIRSATPSRAGAGTIVHVGRFDKPKGADRVVKAFKRALQVRPMLRLVVIGPDVGISERPGAAIEHFDAYAERVLTPAERRQIDFLGVCSPAEVMRQRAQASLVVVASRRENQPYAAIEAMAQACPVLCADTPNLRESVQHGRNGWLFDPDSEEDFAAKMVAAIDAPDEAGRLALQARQDVLERHDVLRVARLTCALYERAAETSLARSAA